MPQPQEKKVKPIKFEFDFGFTQFFASLLIVGLFFVLPIITINDWPDIVGGVQKVFDVNSTNSIAKVAGIYTDNSGRYYQIPIIQFSFDTTLREPSTLSFLFGLILLILSIIILLILFADFRKKEKKYR